jgi:hypothetical protein
MAPSATSWWAISFSQSVLAKRPPCQSVQTTTSLRIGYMIVLGVPMILAGVFVYFFPITHQRAMENRRLLDERVAATLSNW